jgi:hypothetical protein
MKTTMTATTQQFNGTRIGKGTATGTMMTMMSATTTVVATKAAVLTDSDVKKDNNDGSNKEMVMVMRMATG